MLQSTGLQRVRHNLELNNNNDIKYVTQCLECNYHLHILVAIITESYDLAKVI